MNSSSYRFVYVHMESHGITWTHMHTGRESPHHSRRDAKPPGATGGLRLRVSASRGGWGCCRMVFAWWIWTSCAKPNNEPFGDDSNYPSIVILGMIDYWVGPAVTDLNGKQTPGILAYGNHRLGWILRHCTFKLATVWQHDPFFCASEAAGEALATAGSTGAGWSGMVMEHKWPWCIIKIMKLQNHLVEWIFRPVVDSWILIWKHLMKRPYF